MRFVSPVTVRPKVPPSISTPLLFSGIISPYDVFSVHLACLRRSSALEAGKSVEMTHSHGEMKLFQVASKVRTQLEATGKSPRSIQELKSAR